MVSKAGKYLAYWLVTDRVSAFQENGKTVVLANHQSLSKLKPFECSFA
ncbi:hypothetical protein [Scytonema sp. NUACC21]